MKINNKVLVTLFAAAVFTQGGLHASFLVIDGYGDEKEDENSTEQVYIKACSSDDEGKEESFLFLASNDDDDGKEDSLFF